MSYILCPDGHVVRLGIIPNPHGFNIASEQTTERIGEALEALISLRQELSSEVLFREIYTLLIGYPEGGVSRIYECSECGRLAVFAYSSDNVPLFWYKPEIVNYTRVANSLFELSTKMEDRTLKRDWQADETEMN